MRPALIFSLLAASVFGASAAHPEGMTVVGCDNLVTLRRLMAQDPEGRTALLEFPGCKEIQPDGIGTVERRAMIGDAPYECRSVKEGPCLWIRP